MFSPTVKVLSVASLLLLATVTACSSSSSSTNADVSSGSSSSASPIQIGTVGSYSGPNASSESGAQYSIEAWAKWTNAHGGIDGHPVHLTVVDDGGNAATAATGVQELIQQDHVVAIVGEASNLDVSWASIADKAGVPVVGGLSLDLPFETDPNFYPSGANNVAMLYGALKLAKPSGARFADIYCAEAPACAAGGPLYAAIAQTLGMTVPLQQAASASSPDYTAVCQAIKSDNINAYTLSLSGAVIVKVAGDCVTQGVKATLVLTDGVVTPALLSSPGTQNLLSAEIDAPFFADSTPATKAYRSALKQYEPSIVGTPQDNPIAQYAWVGGQLFAAAVEASGASNVTSASVKEGLYKLKNETLGGLAPPLNFTPGKPAHIDCTFTIGVKNGAFTEPDGLKVASCVPDDLVTKVLSASS